MMKKLRRSRRVAGCLLLLLLLAVRLKGMRPQAASPKLLFEYLPAVFRAELPLVDRKAALNLLNASLRFLTILEDFFKKN